jgi:ADP-ribose diphosphatase
MIRSVGGKRLFAGKVFDVVRDGGLDLVVHGPAVAVVAFDRDDRAVLVRQRRAGAGRELVELPAGRIEPGEQPLACARRELSEETGLCGGRWRELATFFTTPGFCDELMHLFLADELDEGEPSPDEGEVLTVVRVPRGRLPQLLPELEDAKTLVGLLLADGL